MHTTLLALASATVLAGCSAAPSTVVIDGIFDDWTNVAAVAVDPAGDGPDDAFADLRSISASADGTFLHLRVDFGRPVNIQRLVGSAAILLDVDGSAATGREHHGMTGVDVIVMLTAPSARRPDDRGMGIGVLSTTWTPPAEDAHAPTGMISPYTIGFTFGPTYQSQTVEFRIDRGAAITDTPPLFTSDACRIGLALFDADRNVLDTAGPLAVALPPLTDARPALARTLQRTDGADARIVSWNVQYSSLLHNPDPFIAVLRALQPDILLLQELKSDTTREQVESLLNSQLAEKGQTWSVTIGAGGGNLRSAVATCHPAGTIDSLHTLTYRDRPDRTIRHAAAVITIADRPLLAASIHLRCCGDADSYEEEIRLMEVDVLHEALRSVLDDHLVDGLVIAGDFNLVGAHLPLQRLADALDVDGSDLAVAQPLQLDGRSNATWADPDQPFVPGRLDYVLCSDAALAIVGSFVLDAADLPADLQHATGITADATARASDHLPVIVDIAWTDAPAEPTR